MTDALSIAVVGAGAIGSAVAFSLARAGFSPKLIARGATLEAIRRIAIGAGHDESIADFVGSRWMSSSSSSVSGLVNALLRVTFHIVLNPWSQLCCDVTGLWLSAFS